MNTWYHSVRIYFHNVDMYILVYYRLSLIKIVMILCKLVFQLFTFPFSCLFFNSPCSLCLIFFQLLAQKPNLEKISIYSSKFIHNFHLSVSNFTCPGLRSSGLVPLFTGQYFLQAHLFRLIFQIPRSKGR
jgi:hypothetical protein